MKEIYTKEIVGYIADDHFYCKDCWEEYLQEKRMTGTISIDEEVWEHDLFSERVDEIEGSPEELRCCRCGCVFAPKRPWEETQVFVHE